MRRLSRFLALLWVGGWIAAPPAPAAQTPQIVREQLPGRQVKVAALCIGFGGAHDEKLKLALAHLHTAGKSGVDIACLPEEFAGTKAEPVPGPTTNAVAALAKQYQMYVICPLREQAGERQYNTAVLLDRQGQVAGYYRKVFVFWGEGVHCSTEGVKVFKTDFGRICILTCFDLNYPELWQRCNELDADIVFWPSAYGCGSPLNAYAILYHYYIVPVGAGNLMDITGKPVDPVEKPLVTATRPEERGASDATAKSGSPAPASPAPQAPPPLPGQQFIATLDLDRSFAHYDFNEKKVREMLSEHEGEMVVERKLSDEDLAPWWLFRATKPGVRVRDILKEHKIETLREYQHRSRRQINAAREKGERI